MPQFDDFLNFLFPTGQQDQPQGHHASKESRDPVSPGSPTSSNDTNISRKSSKIFFLNLTSLDDFQRFLENLKALAIFKLRPRTYQRGLMVVSKKTLTRIQKLWLVPMKT